MPEYAERLCAGFATTWVGKILGGLLLIGLAGFRHFKRHLLDLGSNTLANVGDEDITIQQFQRAYQQQLNQVAQQIGQHADRRAGPAARHPVRGDQQARLGRRDQPAGEKLGLGVSDARLAKMVREDPSFAGTLGNFERGNLRRRCCSQNGFTEAEYFELQTRAARRQQMALGLFAGTAVPEPRAELSTAIATTRARSTISRSTPPASPTSPSRPTTI